MSNLGTVCYLVFQRKWVFRIPRPLSTHVSDFIAVGECASELLMIQLIVQKPTRTFKVNVKVTA